MWAILFPGWQTVYDNDLYEILESNGGTTADKKRITGGEVALWTETVRVFLKYSFTFVDLGALSFI